MPDQTNPFSNLFPRAPIFGGQLIQMIVSGCSNTIHYAGVADHLVLKRVTEAKFIRPVLLGDQVIVHALHYPEDEGTIEAEGLMTVNRAALNLHDPEKEIGLKPEETAMQARMTFCKASTETLATLETGGQEISLALENLITAHAPTLRMAANSGNARTNAGYMRAGWTLSQADLAAAVCVNRLAAGRDLFVTGSVQDIDIHGTVCYGDAVHVYSEMTRIGTPKPSSASCDVHILASRASTKNTHHVLSAKFNMVCLDRETRRPKDIGSWKGIPLQRLSGDDIPDELRFG